MRGPIDYIVVGFEGNKFNGSILKEIGAAIDKGIINLLVLSVVSRDENDNVTTLDISELGNEYLVSFVEKYQTSTKADQDDLEEVADLIEKNCTAGLLVIEHVWAKPLKQALINANGVLLAEGRIHPEAAQELEN